MYTWLPIHGVSSTCEVTISDILCVCCVSCSWHWCSFTISREKTTHSEMSFISISQYSYSWERVRGAIFIMTVSLLAGICWHNLISWQSPCIMYEHLARANSGGGGGGGFLQQKCFCEVEKENWPPLWVLYVLNYLLFLIKWILARMMMEQRPTCPEEY